MNIRLALLLTLMFSVASIAPGYAAGDRYALVIGNAKYPDAEAPLREPINDARDIAEELKRDGFSVEIGENLSRLAGWMLLQLLKPCEGIRDKPFKLKPFKELLH